MRALLALTLLAAAPHLVAGDDMVAVPAGRFVMGRDDGPPDERPAHRVELAAYRIDRLPVTNAQFAAFLERHGARAPDGARYFDDDDADARIRPREGRWRADPGFERHPVVEAAWLGALAYCRSLGKRLPAEAEWEKAARGTDGRLYPWGNAPPGPALAWYGRGWNETAPVGERPGGASPFGVLELSGNVWEWVSSAYRPYPYLASDGREDPAPGPVRGTRGGAHDSGAAELTATQRGRQVSRNPAAGHHNIGFRCAR